VFEQCRRCHEAPPGATASAPNLEGIVGRRIASKNNFNYSPALQAMGKRKKSAMWSEKQLQKFLINPNKFAPGTSMAIPGMNDPTERAVLIEYLKTYKP